MYYNTAEKLAEIATIDGYKIVAVRSAHSSRCVYSATHIASNKNGLIFLYPSFQRSSPLSINDAIKILSIDVAAIGRLEVPRALAPRSAGALNGIPYVVTDPFKGYSARELLGAHGKLPPHAAFNILRQCASAIDRLHENVILHLSLSPENILIDANGGAVIEGFGVLPLLEQFAGVTGQVLTDLRTHNSYRSPEQILETNISRKSDLFSFGLIAYELITGFSPFGGATFEKIEDRIVKGERRDLSLLFKEAPADADAVFAKMLSPKPESRYHSAEEFVENLERAFAKANLMRNSGFSYHPHTASKGNAAWRKAVPEQTEEQAGTTPPPPSPNRPRTVPFSSRTPGQIFETNESLEKRVIRRSGNLALWISVLSFGAILMAAGIIIVLRSPNLGAPASQPAEAPTQSETALDAPAIAVAPPDRPVTEMTEKELLGVIWEGKVSEETLLAALGEAQRRGIPDLGTSVIRTMSSEYSEVRTLAAKIAGEKADPRVQTYLFPLLEDEIADVRYEAAIAVGKMGDSKAVGFLISRYMTEGDEKVKDALRKSIEKLNGFPFNG